MDIPTLLELRQSITELATVLPTSDMNITEVGRMLSADNEKAIRSAIATINTVLARLGSDSVAPGASLDRGSDNPNPDMAESVQFTSEEVTFAEALSKREDGATLIKIIQPGQGSSGYYSREVLQRDGPNIFPAGTHMYLDHPSKAEERDRPERSVKDLAAVTVDTPRYLTDGKYGEGLYTHAKFFSGHEGMVNEMAPHIGVSIRGAGVGKPGTVEGRKTYVFEKLTHGESIDLVTHAGAGGAIVSESAIRESKGVVTMTDEEKRAAEAAEAAKKVEEAKASEDGKPTVFQEVAELREVTRLQAEMIKNMRVRESVRDASDLIMSEMAKHPRLPDAMKERIRDNAIASLPLKDDGGLDAEKLTARVKEAVDAESLYLQRIGVTPIRNMNASESASGSGELTQESASKELMDAMIAGGMTEKQAKLALGSRV